MEWLQQHMRRHLEEGQRESNVLSFRPQVSPAEAAGAGTLELLEQAIAHILRTEEAAEERARGLEMARRAAESQVEREAMKLHEMTLALERAGTELAAARLEVSAAESRARDAERRATDAEDAMKSIATTMHVFLSEKQKSMGAAA